MTDERIDIDGYFARIGIEPPRAPSVDGLHRIAAAHVSTMPFNNLAILRGHAIRLDAGQEMDDHQVRERAWVVVVEGRAQIRSGDEQVDGGVGTLVTFAPGERHAVSSLEGARLLLLLAPWPGPGHYLDGEAPSQH